MTPTRVALFWCLASTLGAARAAHAVGGAAADAYDDITAGAAVDAHGLLDVYGLHNFDAPASKRNELRAVDVYDQPARLGYLRLTLAHRPERVGFRVDAGFGDTAKYFERQDPAVESHPDLARAASYFGQAFVTARIPAESAVAIDVGRFGTPMGLEDNEAWQNWSYSRSLLYTWAEPTQHTGVRVSCAVTDALALSAVWDNGWNAVFFDGSDMRTGALAATWRATEALILSVTDMLGPERALTGPPTYSFRNLLDAFAVYEASDHLSLAFTGDYGFDGARGGVSWYGAAGAARLRASPWLAAVLRAEVFDDASGFTTGTTQVVAEGTATLEASGAFERLRWATRLEARHDHSSARPFDGATPASLANQTTLTLALLAAFP
jgi:hypothetical protein